MTSPLLDTTHDVNVGCGMTLPPLDCTHGQQCQAWHAIIAFGLADAVGRRRSWHAIIALGRQTWSNDVWHGMPSSPLGSTNGRTTSGVACHSCPWSAQTVGNVERGMTSPPLDSTHGQKRRAWHDIAAFGKHTRSDVRRDMPSPPLDSTHDRTTLGMACHHHLWAAQMVRRRRAWHAIVALGRQTRSNDVRHEMPSSPLGSTHGRHRQAWHVIMALGHHTRSNELGRGMPS